MTIGLAPDPSQRIEWTGTSPNSGHEPAPSIAGMEQFPQSGVGGGRIFMETYYGYGPADHFDPFADRSGPGMAVQPLGILAERQLRTDSLNCVDSLATWIRVEIDAPIPESKTSYCFASAPAHKTECIDDRGGLHGN